MQDRKKILIVENEITLSDELENHLVKNNMNVVKTCTTGEETVEFLTQEEVDLILMDISLDGELDGFKTAQQISHTQIPIIFLTAYDRKENLKKTKFENCYGYLQKPYRINELLTTIDLAFQKVSMKDELIRSQNQFRTFIDEIKEGFGVVDANENFIFVNPAAVKILGYTKEELLDFNVRDLVSKEEFKKVKEQTTIRQKNKSSKYELRMKCKNGEVKIIEVNANPHFIDGKYKGAFAIFSDVSKERLDEELLKESNRNLQRIFQHIQDIYFEVDFDGTILQISPAVENHSKYKRKHLIGSSIYDLYLNSAEREIYLNKLKENEYLTNYPVTLIDKDSTPFTCFISSRIIIAPESKRPRIIGSLHTSEDIKLNIEEYKAVEEQYQEFLNKPDNNIQENQLKLEKIKEKLLRIYENRKRKLIDRTNELVAANQKLLNEISERKEIEKKLKEKSLSQNRLLKIAKYINSSLDTKEVLKRIADEVMELLDSYGAAIYTYDKSKNELIPQVVIDPDYKDEIQQTPLKIEGSFTGKAVINKKCMIFNDAWQNDDGFQIPGTSEQKDERIISAPFIFDEQVIGALCLNRIGEVYTEEERDLVESFANYATIAIKNAQNYQKIQQEIEERISAEKALDETEKRFTSLWSNVSVGVFRSTPDGEFLGVNPAMVTMFGFNSAEEMKKNNAIDLYPEANDRKIILEQLEKQGSVENFEVQLRKNDGTIFWTSLHINKILNDNGEWIYQDGIVTDVTERKKFEKTQQVINNIANAALENHDLPNLYEKIHNELAEIIDTKNFYIALYNKEKDIITAPYYKDQIKDHTPKPQPLGKGLTGLVIRSGKSHFIREKERNELIAKKLIPEYDWKAKVWIGVPLKKNNEVIGAMAVQSYDNENAYDENDLKMIEFVSGQIASTISRKEYEKALEESEQLNRAIIDNSPIGITVRDNRGTLLKANEAWKNIWHRDRIGNELYDKRNHFKFDEHDNYLEDHYEKIERVYKTGGNYTIPELKVHSKRFSNPIWISHHFYAIEDENGNVDKVVILTDDITRKKETEIKFHKTQSRLSTIFKNVPNIILYEYSKNDQFVSNNVETLLGYSTEDFLDNKISFDDIIHPQDREVVDEKFNKWKNSDDKELLSLWYRVKKKSGDYIWIEDRVVEIQNRKGENYIAGVKIDITNLKRSKEKLQQLLTETVNGLISAVEMRDPYTAGHQKRVASLALEVAREMNLPKDVIDGIHIAALVHDIGKINIPSEILSKPGGLSTDEFEIIKMHPQTGYDILKKIDFPWPIADIVLQHQERLDGSSYPNGLKGEQICMHARIISVADVIEAMSSHRPYRPAVGLDAALTEIEKNKGLLYDERVVETCLKLFHEKKFEFPEVYHVEEELNREYN